MTSQHTEDYLIPKKKREMGPKSPDVAECSYIICLHNAPAPMQTTQKATVLWWGGDFLTDPFTPTPDH